MTFNDICFKIALVAIINLSSEAVKFLKYFQVFLNDHKGVGKQQEINLFQIVDKPFILLIIIYIYSR
jgi:hypothetical protein